MNRLILIGPPATGKGTQAVRMSESLHIPHISTGDILREEVQKGTEIGKQIKTILDEGDLVPDRVVIQLLDNRLKKPDCKKGFILDGFPRDLEQAKELDKLIVIDQVILIESKEETIIKRVVSRRMCPVCGTIYGIDIPPKKSNFCDHDRALLVHRADDTVDAIKHRLKVYDEKTAPLIQYYARKLIRVNGDQQIDKLYSQIIRKLAS